MHDEHGAGWGWGSAQNRVTVRFEGHVHGRGRSVRSASIIRLCTRPNRPTGVNFPLDPEEC